MRAAERDLLRMLAKALALGYTLSRGRRSGHYALSDPDGRRVATIAGTPSCPRSAANMRAQLRRAGVPL